MPEDIEKESSEANLEAQMAALKGELEQVKRELEKQLSLTKEYLDSAKRIQADFDNYKKRALRDREEQAKCANEKVVADLLTIIDDFERALAAQCELADLKVGIEKIHDNLMTLLQGYGLKEIPMKERFDPNYHEALSTGEGKEGTILEVYQKGYLLGPRVLRYSKVKVAREKGDQNG